MVLMILNGIFLGIVLTVAVEAYFIYRMLIRPYLSTQGASDDARPKSKRTDTVPDRSTDEPWPQNILQFLKWANVPSEEPGQFDIEPSMIWFNACLHRYFLECRSSPIFSARLRQKLKEKLTKRFSNDSLSSTASLVLGLDVTQISIGDHPPIFKNMVMLQSSGNTQQSMDVTLETEIDYAGGMCVTIVATLSLGIRIPVTVELGPLSGKLQIRVPCPISSSEYAMAFVEDPEIILQVESSLWRKDNEMFKDVLNTYIVKRLRAIFVDVFVLPNFRSFDLPLVTYRPVTIPELDNISPSSSNQHTETGFTTANRRRSTAKSVSSGTPVGDAFVNCFDSTTSVITENNVLQMRESLISEVWKTSTYYEKNCTSHDDMWFATPWVTIRTKRDISLQKRMVIQNSTRSEIYRSVFAVSCAAEIAAQILQNIEHLHHVDDHFAEAHSIRTFDSENTIKRLVYRFGRQEKQTIVLETRKTIQPSETSANYYVVAYRSVGIRSLELESINSSRETNSMYRKTNAADLLAGSIGTRKTAEPSSPAPVAKAHAHSSLNVEKISGQISSSPELFRKDVRNMHVKNEMERLNLETTISKLKTMDADQIGRIYIYAYIIEPLTSRSCQIITISQFGPQDMQKLNITWSRSYKLKLFIDELIEWTGKVEAIPNVAQVTQMFRRRSSSVNSERSENFEKKGAVTASERWKSLRSLTTGFSRINILRQRPSASSSQENQDPSFSNSSRPRSLSDGFNAD